MADSVLTGDQAAHLSCLGVDILHEHFDVLLEGRLIDSVVAACIDVEVTVSSMTEALDLEAVSLLCGFDILEILRDLCDGNDYVALIQPLGLGLDRLEEGRTGRPRVALLGGRISDQNIDRALFEDYFRCLLNQVIELVKIVTVESDEQVGTDFYAADLLGEGLSADKSLGSENDLSLHELYSLGIQAVLHEQRNCCDAVIQVLVRDDQ